MKERDSTWSIIPSLQLSLEYFSRYSFFFSKLDCNFFESGSAVFSRDYHPFEFSSFLKIFFIFSYNIQTPLNFDKREMISKITQKWFSQKKNFHVKFWNWKWKNFIKKKIKRKIFWWRNKGSEAQFIINNEKHAEIKYVLHDTNYWNQPL